MFCVLFFARPHATLTRRHQTFGEMSPEQKAEISHRGRALRLLKDHLLNLV
jgi:inosine/xanthosine triphosphate pyrophosphatase family protein